MRLIKTTREMMWRAIEWAFVMGGLTWLFVRMWSESVRLRLMHAGTKQPSAASDQRPPTGRGG
jgi:hypothetical protein